MKWSAITLSINFPQSQKMHGFFILFTATYTRPMKVLPGITTAVDQFNFPARRWRSLILHAFTPRLSSIAVVYRFNLSSDKYANIFCVHKCTLGNVKVMEGLLVLFGIEESQLWHTQPEIFSEIKNNFGGCFPRYRRQQSCVCKTWYRSYVSAPIRSQYRKLQRLHMRNYIPWPSIHWNNNCLPTGTPRGGSHLGAPVLSGISDLARKQPLHNCKIIWMAVCTY